MTAVLANDTQGLPYAPNVTITKPNAFVCPGQWVIHEVDGLLYTPVKDPLLAAAPALDLSYALGGQWDTYTVLPTSQGASGSG